MSPTRVILLSCGSYNPPTNMHLRMFEVARDHLHRMGTHLVVGGVISPVHDSYGKKELVNSEHRCEMLNCALKNNDWIRVSTWESRQNNWSPTRLVLQHHQNLLNTVLVNSSVDIASRDLEWIPETVRNSNDKTPIQIKLLCGADLLESFGIPGLWMEEDIDAIVGQHGLVVITREGSNPNKFIYDSDVLSRHMHNIYIVTEWIFNEISSTKIRRALKRGESVRYLLQDPVIDYVQCHGLYNAKTLTKLILSSTNNDSNNYLQIETNNESEFLTPSPSDIIMATPSPVEIISIDIAQSVIKKNLVNLPKSRTTPSKSISNAADDNELMREKFMNVIAENGNNKNSTISKSFYPGQAKQIIATETGESLILNEVGSQNTGTSIKNNDDDCINDGEKNLEIFKDNCKLKCEIDNTISEMNTEVDGNLLSSFTDSETIRPDAINIENSETSQEGIDNCFESEISGKNDEKNVASCSKIQKNTEVNDKLSSSTIVEVTEKKINELPSDHRVEEETKPRKSLDSNCRDEINGKYRKSILSSRRSPTHGNELAEQVVPKMIDAKDLKQKVQKTDAKNYDLTKFKSESNKKNYLGSFESINSNKPTTLSKKSKSYEFIKTDFSLKEIDINEDVPSSPQKSSSSSVFVTANDDKNDQQDNETIDELCSVCCYSKNQSSSKNIYSVHSNNSSPLELDSTECELCSSYNLQDTETVPGEPQCELCEICGDVALDMDVVASSRPETDDLIDTRIFAGARHLPLNVAKQKITSGRMRMEGKIFDATDEDVDGEDADDEIQRLPSTSIEEYSADDSTLDDVEFEIENSGLEDVNELGKIPDESLESVENDDKLKNVESKRSTRGSSLIARNALRPDAKRRYSSVDNLPSSKQRIKSTSNDSKKFVGKNKKTTSSVDNIRVSRLTKERNKLRKSADDVAKTSQDAKKNKDDTEMQLAGEKSVEKKNKSSDEHLVEPDIIKFIITKHGLKIISDKETSL